MKIQSVAISVFHLILFCSCVNSFSDGKSIRRFKRASGTLVPVSPTDSAAFLTAINTYRSQSLPIATKMTCLSYDSATLSTNAQTKALTCDPSGQTNMQAVSFDTTQKTLSTVLDAWVNQFYDANNDICFDLTCNDLKAVYNDQSNTVGCAQAQCAGGWLTVCEFSNPYAAVGSPYASGGAACSLCSASVPCVSNLCCAPTATTSTTTSSTTSTTTTKTSTSSSTTTTKPTTTSTSTSTTTTTTKPTTSSTTTTTTTPTTTSTTTKPTTTSTTTTTTKPTTTSTTTTTTTPTTTSTTTKPTTTSTTTTTTKPTTTSTTTTTTTPTTTSTTTKPTTTSTTTTTTKPTTTSTTTTTTKPTTTSTTTTTTKPTTTSTTTTTTKPTTTSTTTTTTKPTTTSRTTTTTKPTTTSTSTSTTKPTTTTSTTPTTTSTRSTTSTSSSTSTTTPACTDDPTYPCSTTDYCILKPALALVYCKKTCNNCGSTCTCYDSPIPTGIGGNCNGLPKSFCVNTATWQKCPVQCSKCSTIVAPTCPPCVDTITTCTSKLCDSTPGLFLPRCQQTCNNCDGCKCKDSITEPCYLYPYDGRCGLADSFRYCPVTCNSCNKVMKTGCTEMCQDLNPNTDPGKLCSAFNCENSPGLYLPLCHKTCNNCNKCACNDNPNYGCAAFKTTGGCLDPGQAASARIFCPVTCNKCSQVQAYGCTPPTGRKKRSRATDEAVSGRIARMVSRVETWFSIFRPPRQTCTDELPFCSNVTSFQCSEKPGKFMQKCKHTCKNCDNAFTCINSLAFDCSRYSATDCLEQQDLSDYCPILCKSCGRN